MIYYIGSGVLIAAGLNYFYFSYGYSVGGTYQFYFTVVYAIATFAGQFSYQPIINKLKIGKLKLFEIASLITIVSYLGLFLFVFVPDYITLFPLLCVAAFIAFFGQTIMSLILYIMIQDTIDYNMYKFNERREAAIFSLRAFTAKLADSIKQLILYVFLLASSLFVVSNQIANLEREYQGQSDYIIQEADKITGAGNIELWQRVVFHIGFTIIPLILFLIVYLLIKFKYNITEKDHEMMLKEIEERNK